MGIIVLIILIIVNVILFHLVKHKDKIWEEIYKKLGLIKDE